MSVADLAPMEPPYTRSLGYIDRGVVALERGPRLVRTRGMGRWHRPRCGVLYPAERSVTGRERTRLTLWCGQGVDLADCLTRADLPDGELLCGTCEGRAVGAGYLPVVGEPGAPLVHRPVSSRPPPVNCPSGRISRYTLERFPYGRDFPCPACADPVRLRLAGGWSNPHVAIAAHPPGPGLIPPCPHHRWDQLVLIYDHAGCRCTAPITRGVL